MRTGALVVLASVFLTLPVEAGASTPRCGGRRATIVGTGGHDLLRGTPDDDVIVGGKGHDTLVGLEGDDRLCGRGGGDSLFGGRGNDILAGGTGVSDLLLGGPGDDALNGGVGSDDSVSYVFGPGAVEANVETGTAAGDGSDSIGGVEHLTGSDHADTITGDSGSNDLHGGGGSDFLFGGGGSDRLFGGPDDDDLDGGDGGDSVLFLSALGPVEMNLASGSATGDGSDTLTGIEGGTGSDYDDVLVGNSGPNGLEGDLGYDELSGGAGNDFLDGGRDGAEGDAGPGEDTCTSVAAAGCEQFVVTDYFFGSSIARPGHEETLDNEGFLRLRGRVLEGVFGSPTGVRVGLRRMSSNGCRWWDAQVQELVARPCADPLLVRTRLSSSSEGRTWAYRLPVILPPGTYRALSRAFGGNLKEPGFFFGQNEIDFRMT